MLDFPANPTVGQIFVAGGVTWKWDGAKWVPSGAGRASPLAYSITGKPAANAKINVAMPWAASVPANLAGSVGYASTAATAAATFTVNKISGGTTTALGTMVFPAGGGAVTLAGAGGTLAINDTLQVIAPGTQDSTLADISVTVWTGLT